MEYTLLCVFAILFILLFKNKNNKVKNKIVRRQSTNHMIFTNFIINNVPKNKKTSQMTKRNEKEGMKVVFTEENKAYWVVNNIFYVSDVIDSDPDFKNAKPVDTSNMSKNELDKMLSILDNIKRGDKNERGSTGK